MKITEGIYGLGESNFQPLSLSQPRKADTRPACQGQEHNTNLPLPTAGNHTARHLGDVPINAAKHKASPMRNVPAVSQTLAKLRRQPHPAQIRGQRHSGGDGPPPPQGEQRQDEGTGQGEGRPWVSRPVPSPSPQPRAGLAEAAGPPREGKLAVTVTRHRAGTKAPESAAAAEAGYSLPGKGGGRGGSEPGAARCRETRPEPRRGGVPAGPGRESMPPQKKRRAGPAGRQAPTLNPRCPPGDSAPHSAPLPSPPPSPHRAAAPRFPPGPPPAVAVLPAPSVREGKLCPSLERRRREPGSRALLTTFPATSSSSSPPPARPVPRCCSRPCSPQPSSAKGPPAAPRASSPPGSRSLRAPLSRTPAAARRGRRGSQRTLRRARDTPASSSGGSCGDCCPLLPPSVRSPARPPVPPPPRCQAEPRFRPPPGPPLGPGFRSQHGAGRLPARLTAPARATAGRVHRSPGPWRPAGAGHGGPHG